MERELAELVVADLKEKKEMELTVLEVMSMTKIMSDNIPVYAIQKSRTTVLAEVQSGPELYVKTKIVKW